ncbi:MAG: chromosomal replication initiator protein DnaA [Candidatus Saccharibacteria bacterium]|nr:chromosomal replication initiator protein DnaA [Candidatus Saccharibacteria bacterium]
MFNVWNNVLAEIEQSLSHEAFATWFSGVELLSINDGIVHIGTPNIFKVEQIKRRYDGAVRAALAHNGIVFNEVIYEAVNSASKVKKKAREVDSSSEDTPLKQSTAPRTGFRTTSNLLRNSSATTAITDFNNNGLNPEYSLDNFIIGTNNDLAVSVARSIIESPGGRFNPFFLYGGPGLGKTHLVQATGNALAKKDPSLKILYISTNDFYTEFINLIRKSRANSANNSPGSQIDDFSQKFRHLDVLIIDDFQMIVGKEASQNAFFNIFNDLHQHNKQIIITSDRLPDQLKTLDARLSSRLNWTGPIDLQMPNFEDKCAILKAKADYMGKEVDDVVIEYIAENIRTNIRDLEGELNRILLYSEVRNISPTDVIAGGLFQSHASSRRSLISPKKIIEKTAKEFEITPVELTSRSRVKTIKTARQVAMYLMSEELGLSTTNIAREVGVKDHTTAMHGIKKIKTDLKTDYSLREKVESSRTALYN